jgi:hypothetical protein
MKSLKLSQYGSALPPGGGSTNRSMRRCRGALERARNRHQDLLGLPRNRRQVTAVQDGTDQ